MNFKDFMTREELRGECAQNALMLAASTFVLLIGFQLCVMYVRGSLGFVLPLLVVWPVLPAAFLIAVPLIVRSWPRKTARAAAVCELLSLCVLIWVFTSHSHAFPVRKALGECRRLSISRYGGAVMVYAVADRDDLSGLRNPAPLRDAYEPKEAPDMELTFNLQSSPDYARAHFYAPTTYPEYACDYYSREGIIGDAPTQEYVYASPALRAWIRKAAAQGGSVTQ
ncbi:hypothetical protein CCAX7_001250 [Capsulimonas corticalis]|uniref:Uncharacterized protein n=1 Tax=Capsulimonas corticalis TaxID=2219043 RepID=A0A402CRN2_9BACT|nr:hypothetical protein [Capsulimonas corticalis]BDI28074.1 hypothetical protein CCAX7_001250 [Capsulimonas corticalis]